MLGLLSAFGGGVAAVVLAQRALKAAGSQVVGECLDCGREFADHERYCPDCGNGNPTRHYEPETIEEAAAAGYSAAKKKKMIGTIRRLRERGLSYDELAERVPYDKPEVRTWNEQYREGPEKHEWVREVEESNAEIP